MKNPTLPLSFKNSLRTICRNVANHLPEPSPTPFIENFRLRFKSRYDKAYTLLLGKKIRVPDVASYLFMKRELFDLEIYKFKASSPSPFILDCGANIGLSALYFKHLYPNCKLIAFEPDTTIFQYLQYNVHTAFGHGDIQLVPKALWDKETELYFMEEGADGGKIVPTKEESTTAIKTVRLKSYLKKKVDFLKLDIEGAETTVILDCAEALENVENIFIEYHSYTNKPQQLDQILAVLNKAGFRYNLQHAMLYNQNPFIQKNDFMGIDSLINIFAYRS